MQSCRNVGFLHLTFLKLIVENMFVNSMNVMSVKGSSEGMIIDVQVSSHSIQTSGDDSHQLREMWSPPWLPLPTLTHHYDIQWNLLIRDTFVQRTLSLIRRLSLIGRFLRKSRIMTSNHHLKNRELISNAFFQWKHYSTTGMPVAK